VRGQVPIEQALLAELLAARLAREQQARWRLRKARFALMKRPADETYTNVSVVSGDDEWIVAIALVLGVRRLVELATDGLIYALIDRAPHSRLRA